MLIFSYTDQVAIKGLLDKLLDLQTHLLSKNKDTRSIVAGEEGDSQSDSQDQPDMDEEISSDFEDENDDTNDPIASYKDESSDDDDDAATDDAKNSNQDDVTGVTINRRAKWVLPNGRRNYEEYIGGVYKRMHPYRDATINKWNTKIRLSSGKINSKVREMIYIHECCSYTIFCEFVNSVI